MDGWFHASVDRCRSTQVAFSLVGDRLGKVASTAAAMHRLSLRGEAKSLLGPFVGLDFCFSLSLCHPFSLTSFIENFGVDRRQGARIAEQSFIGKS